MDVDNCHFINNLNKYVFIKIEFFSHVFFDSVLSHFSYNLPHSRTLDIEIFGPYEQISDVGQDDLCNLTGIHTQDIGISGQYE